MGGKRAADMKTIVDWATEYFSSKNDNELVEGLMQLQKLYAKDTQNPESTNAAACKDGQPSDNVPLYTAFYKLRTLSNMLGPMYLGFSKTEDSTEAQQPWTLKLERAGKPGRALRRSDSDTSISDDDGNRSAPKRRKLNEPSASNKSLKDWPVFHDSNAAALDIPEVVRMLIIVENTRRYYASELLSKKHAQGPLGDQSERWEHGFAKRNIAAETKFENLLVALKELVVLRTIADPVAAERGDIKQVLKSTGTWPQQPDHNDDAPAPAHAEDANSKTSAVTLSNRFDPAKCLAILNIMFPLDPLHTDRRVSFNTGRLQQRYAFPLQHVPSPRTQLHQLICEVEAWINGEDCRGIPAFNQKKRLHADQRTSGPMSCPAWLASAHSFTWGQFNQSLKTYLQDTELKIATQHRMIHPWSSPEASFSRPSAASQNNGISFSEHILNENEGLLTRIESTSPVNATVLEHIVHHSRLADLRFTKRLLLDQLKL
ncbi:hypothetical protein GGI23_004097 [Coemansia sp. RSA 2559]|nr:hypothetical protein GGI23_004097 [Coemansia sp. RSA 2559]